MAARRDAPDVVRFRGVEKTFPSAQAGYVWLQALGIPKYFATDTDTLFQDLPTSMGMKSAVAPLPNGWAANVKFSHAQELEIAGRLAQLAPPSSPEDWEWIIAKPLAWGRVHSLARRA